MASLSITSASIPLRVGSSIQFLHSSLNNNELKNLFIPNFSSTVFSFTELYVLSPNLKLFISDFIDGVTVDGNFTYAGHNVYSRGIDPVEVRRNIGMVFQKPNPFPKTIYKNISWGPQINGFTGSMDELVEKSLRQAALWDEVRDRLHESALGLSGGQQQRLCIARALAMEPDILLMDEPCSALDPISTSHIEDLLFDLKRRYTIVIVTHNMQQAARISDYTAFLEMGDLIEFGITDQIFTRPNQKRTEEYVTGRFG